MNRLAVKHNGPGGKRGLRHRLGADSNPFGRFLRRRNGPRREMDRLLEDLWQRNGEASLLAPWSESVLMPLVDETEDDKAYHVEVELPGLDQQDVEVSYSDGVLTISGEKKQEHEESDKNYYRSERSFGAFRRVLPLPGGVDESKIKASFKQGLLHIELPKTSQAQKKAKKISIKSAK